MIILHAHRTFIDGNRSRSTCHSDTGDTTADLIWQYIHGYINCAKQTILLHGSYRSGVLIDLHGQSFDSRTQLGYMLNQSHFDDMTAAQLNSSDTSRASIQSLFNKYNNKLHQLLTPDDILRGIHSLGGFCEKYNISCVPSNINRTLDGRNYFSGAYNTLAHGTSNELINIRKQYRQSQHNDSDDHSLNVTKSILLPYEHIDDVCTAELYESSIISIQVESAFINVRDTEQNRMRWAMNFAHALIEFVDIHLNQ